MAMCAEVWSSARGQRSDRHAAMERMRQRRAGRSTASDEEEEAPAPRRPPARPARPDATPAYGGDTGCAPRPPAAPREGGAPRAPPRRDPRVLGNDGAGDFTPRSHRDEGVDLMEQRSVQEKRGGRNADEDLRAPAPPSLPPPGPRGPPGEKAPKPSPRATEDWSEQVPNTPRSRGPQYARAARRSGAGDDCSPCSPTADVQDEPLPPGVKGASFGTLQEMIAAQIKQAEQGATTLEGDIMDLVDEEPELRRRREDMQRRRKAEEEQRLQERQRAREQRRKETEERLRLQKLQLEQEEEEEHRQREQKKQEEAEKRRTYLAAAKIQSRVRGRRSRRGLPCSSLCVPVKPRR
eukprot:gnl/TRDRNA2_/TRDRNA2_189262_c0_seq1.p1 gnl/TRDRNA2_/TRDRNA2_189262_c0~~gnl/TRDRNA2_/TRDRNA2_189262_c0_seq1.p1  ORF type:complete len:351 (+),score=58.43 gnl/TRDRNA2_/TRDRNA2_189262_c0_seq1:66-1118(+)